MIGINSEKTQILDRNKIWHHAIDVARNDLKLTYVQLAKIFDCHPVTVKHWHTYESEPNGLQTEILIKFHAKTLEYENVKELSKSVKNILNNKNLTVYKMLYWLFGSSEIDNQIKIF